MIRDPEMTVGGGGPGGKPRAARSGFEIGLAVMLR
jgi:hypothetical protein